MTDNEGLSKDSIRTVREGKLSPGSCLNWASRQG